MDSYVVKVQNKGTIRRLTIAKAEKEFSYARLQSRVRDLFQLQPSDQFVLTYTDKDGDVVTMAEDEDLKDALVLQKLNPLRVTIGNVRGGTDVKTSSPILQKEAKSNEIAAEQQNVQGERIPPNLSKAIQVDSEPIKNSGEKTADPGERVAIDNSGGNSSLPGEEKLSKIEGTPDANPPDGPSPLASGTVGDGKGATEDKSPKAEGPKEDLGGRQIHFGIRCDGCRISPISGPRFKSCRKPNYDLCMKCFEASGADKHEYAKIDRLFHRIGFPAYAYRMCRRPDQPQRVTPEGPADAKTAQVVHDGVQCDECGMVPIQGTRYKSTTRFNYDLCPGCFEKGGSNASEYARLDQPVFRHGHPVMMGQLLRPAAPQRRLNPRWVVLNQIVPVLAVEETGSEERTPVEGKVGGDAVAPTPESAAIATSAAEVNADGTPSVSKGEGAVDGQIPVINTKEAVSESSAPKSTQVEVGNVSADNNTVNNSGKSAGGVEGGIQEGAAEGDLSTQEGLLGKLAAMGFEDPKLNAELLEKNGFELRKTLDDLCAAEEWDPILGELQEMGFYDSNMNRRLMFKNNGSVKRVVKELVQMYKGKSQA